MMIKMEVITPPPPSTKLEALEYLKQEYGFTATLADLETNLLPFLEWFQSEERRKTIFEEYFIGNWRSGQEIHKVVITKRLYQTSPNSTQA